jgi:hypothetical protein
MKLLYTSQDRILLYLLKARLDDKHIPIFFKNEQPPLAGEIPPMIAWPQLWLMDDNDFLRAKECIQEELSKRSESNSIWQCPTCQEKLEGQFEICWHCGYARGEATEE